MELKAGQANNSPQGHNGANPPGSHVQACEGQEMIGKTQCLFSNVYGQQCRLLLWNN